MSRPVFLVGMMGSGKSWCAGKLAEWFGLEALDLDTLVEAEAGMTVAGIFEQKGEAWFREAESRALRNLAGRQGIAVATGGGTPCFNENMEWMNSQGVTIWLETSIAELIRRLTPEKAHRPLIKHLKDSELKAFIENKLADRRSWYSQAKFALSETEFNRGAVKKLIDHAA